MRDVDATLRDLRSRGYDVARGKRGHWKIRKGGRLLAVTGSTPSDYRSLRNLQGDLRRAEAGR